MTEKDTEYPEDPARDVCESTQDQDPVPTRAGNARCTGLGNFATLRINSVSKHNCTKSAEGPVRASSLDQDVYGIEVEICLKRYIGENQEEIDR